MFGFYINQTMVPHAAVIFYFSFKKDELITLGCSDYNLPLSSAFYHLYLKVAVQCYNYMWYHCFFVFLFMQRAQTKRVWAGWTDRLLNRKWFI